MKVRAITVGVEPGVPLNASAVKEAGRFITQLRTAYEEGGTPVQTTRVATPPFPSYLQGRTEKEIVRYAVALQDCCRENGIDYCSLGPVRPQRSEEVSYLSILPTVIAETEMVFAAAAIAEYGQIAPHSAVRAVAGTIRQIAAAIAGGFGNLRFAALAHCPPHIPFFPAAYHEGGPSFAIAIEAADVVAAACQPGLELPAVRQRVREEFERQLLPVQALAHRFSSHGYAFRGIDLSPAPGPEPEGSIAYALERLGLGKFGTPGTLTAAATVTAALKETALQTCGYCGLMLPVLEDAGLAERNNQGLLRLSGLLAYSAVCGTGLDTIPLPGDVSEAQLSATLLDVATLSTRLTKPLSARLLPIPGKRVGELTDFDFSYFVNTQVMAAE